MEERASDPRAWPEPFRRNPGHPPQLLEVAPSHFVDATAMPDGVSTREPSLVRVL